MARNFGEAVYVNMRGFRLWSAEVRREESGRCSCMYNISHVNELNSA